MDIIPLKRCTHCKQEYPQTKEFFGTDNRNPDGLQRWCKLCMSAPEFVSRKNERRRKSRQDPAVREREKQLRQTKYRAKENKRQNERYANSPILRIRKKEGDHKRRCTPEFRERRRLLRQDPEYKERERQQRKTEKARIRIIAATHRRRARKKGAEGFYTAADVETQYRSQKGKCWHCGKALNGKFHIDRLVPLGKGGSDWPNNIVCSCAHCNQSKNNKFTYEWNGRLL